MALAMASILIACSTVQAATIQVNTTQQGVTNGLCSLQEAIYASELKSNRAINATAPDSFYTTGCAAGSADGDTIVLPAAAVFTFDHIWDGDAHNPYGPTATPIIFSTMTIEGNGATLQWVNLWSPGNSRLFAIGTVDAQGFAKGTGRLTLRNVYVKGFHIKGGDGGTGGGGGGLGAGGAIYVDVGASLIVENSTFENNGAIGGNGNNLFIGGGGGGGGLSGNGGNGCELSGGGGGGSRGNGGNGPLGYCLSGSGGGGGGGTVFSGGNGSSVSADGTGIGGAHAFRCGANGGDAGNDGHTPACPGGGGGGGGGDFGFLFLFDFGDGGSGSYGGAVVGVRAMVAQAVSAAVEAARVTTMAETAASEGVVEPSMVKGAASVAVLTILPAAAAERWVAPYSAMAAWSTCTTALFSTISSHEAPLAEGQLTMVPMREVQSLSSTMSLR